MLEYSGRQKRFNQDVMGLATLIADNHVELDPVLVWKKPEKWTMQQAATVPFFYSMVSFISYNLVIFLKLNLRRNLTPGGTINKNLYK